MKPYLIDVPVVLYVFIRPNALSQTFDVIRKARPSTLFLISDGPRELIPTDKKLIDESRRVVEEIDWDCKVYKLYSDYNQGMYETFKKSLDFVFEQVDRCIFLEDDVVVSVSFFKYCAELLEKYKDDLRINRICGMNHMGIYDESDADYFYCKTGSIWGFALWRRSYELFYDFTYGDDKYNLKRLKENSRMYKSFCRSLEGYLKNENHDGHLPGPEFFLGFNAYAQNQLTIIPKKNMVCNVGYGNGSTHANYQINRLPKAIQKMFNMKIHEYQFPLKHPKYIIEDKNYERILFRIMGRPLLIKIFRKLEMIIRLILFGEFKTLANKLTKVVSMKKI
jgi:hypothetical protein